MELKTLKTFIKTNLANIFIWPSKFCVKPKTGRSESKKSAKSQKLFMSKSEKSKKPSKSEKSPNFDAMEAGSSFLIPKARQPLTAYN